MKELHSANCRKPVKAKKSVEAGEDLKLGPVKICGTCGYTVEGKAPAKCPICAASDEQFKAFA